MTLAILLVGALILSVLVWAHANQRIARRGVPAGRVVLQDADRRRQLARPLISRRYGVVGKPDYLVETAEGPVPVEIKSRHFPRAGPRGSDIAQLMTYCLLIEENFKKRPYYAVLTYDDGTSPIPYTPEARNDVLQIVDSIREAAKDQNAHRNHSQKGRCRGCGCRAICDEAL